MKKLLLFVLIVFTTLLSSCTDTNARELKELNSLLKTTIDYDQARVLVQRSEQVSPLTMSYKKNAQISATNDPAVQYFLNKYQAVIVSYTIVTANETIVTNFEIRGEVFLNAIQNNVVSITASMPNINYLFVSSQQLEELENINQAWKNSSQALISPFSNKYRYGTTLDHFGFEIKDFTSAAGGMSTTETSNEFSFHASDNRLIKWHFEFFIKDETTGGTNVVNKTIEITFDWILKGE